MATSASANPSPFRAVSAWVPPLLAAAAIALLIGYLATGPHAPNLIVENGVARQDEGASVRTWQLLMALQIATMAFFAVRWLPRDPKRATVMLGLQGVAFVAAALPVLLLEA